MIKFWLCIISVILPITLSTNAFAAPSPAFAINSDLGGVKSNYTDTILRLLKKPLKPVTELQLECYETPGNELYIGIKQALRINASLDKVEAVINDINHYKDLFPGYKDTRIVSQEKNRLLTFWEQHIPLFPNVKYEMIYLIDRSADKVTYRYQLNKAGALKTSDGFITIQKEDATHTQYLEYDFFDAEWGAAKALGKTKIWQDAVEGFLHSDFAVKIKAETPTLTHEEARKLAKREVGWRTVDGCAKNRKTWSEN